MAAPVPTARLSSTRPPCSAGSSSRAPAARATAFAVPAARRQQLPAAPPLAAAAAASQQQPSSSGASAIWGGSSGARRRRRRALPAAAAATEAPDDAQLVPDRQGYRSFMLEGCEFLVAESPEGRLDLGDVFVTTDVPPAGDDGEEGGPAPSYRRPEGGAALGPLPPPREYQAVPWYSAWQGDVTQGRTPQAWVWRYYLVPIAAHEPHLQLALDEDAVWALDARTAALQRCEVHRLAPPGTPLPDLRLRIREDVVTIDAAESLPDWEHVVRARIAGIPSLSKLESARLQEYLDALETARDSGTIDEAEFETAYDVHWLAGMQAGRAGVEALGADWDSVSGGASDDGGYALEPEEDVMGGWDKEMFEDLMQDFDDEGEGPGEYDDFDAPAADY